MLSAGIIGLPNVGKSTLFNALTRGQAGVSNYPFTTLESNVGVIPLPDPRLEELNRLLKPKECTPCLIQFIDIAGLVKGASQGEGLGNQFLGNIRQVDAIVHVVRCFSESDVAHVFEDLDPGRDIEIVETELLLADLEGLNRALERRERAWKSNPREFAKEKERLQLYREHLERGNPLRSLKLDRAAQLELKSLGLLTGKPVLYVANLSEQSLNSEEGEKLLGRLRRAISTDAETIAISAKLEWELQQLEPEERLQFMRALGMEQAGLAALAPKAYRLLGLITFYTVANEKLRAWEVEQGTRAPQAAGKIHSDMEHNFIRAQVTPFESFSRYPNLQELHRHGLVRTEGKDYEVRDGDVIQFLFSS